MDSFKLKFMQFKCLLQHFVLFSNVLDDLLKHKIATVDVKVY